VTLIGRMRHPYKDLSEAKRNSVQAKHNRQLQTSVQKTPRSVKPYWFLSNSGKENLEYPMKERSYHRRTAHGKNGILVASSTTVLVLMSVSSRSFVQGFHLLPTASLNRKSQHHHRRYSDSGPGVNGDSTHTVPKDGIGEQTIFVDPFGPPLKVVAETVSPSTLLELAPSDSIESYGENIDSLQPKQEEEVPAMNAGDATATTADEDVSFVSSGHIGGAHPFAPPLTYEKYLTMQVRVAYRPVCGALLVMDVWWNSFVHDRNTAGFVSHKRD
jgi:hypothetical protein